MTGKAHRTGAVHPGPDGQGLSNTAIAERLYLSDGTISKDTTSTFDKLGIPEDDGTANRRVLAVLAYLNDSQTGHQE